MIGTRHVLAGLLAGCAVGAASALPAQSAQAQSAQEEHWDPEQEGRTVLRRVGGETFEEPARGWTDRHSLTGHFFGLGRPIDGIAIDFAYVADVVGNYRGGLRQRIEYLDRADLLFAIDTEQLLGWWGGSVFADVMGTSGGDPSRQNIGDAQVASNIEAFNTIKLFEAWGQQEFGAGVSLRVGLQDLNVEFDTNGAGALFLNSSHGIGPDFAQSGENGPSIFPTSALGARAAWTFAEGCAVRAIVLDGVAGDPDNPRGTQIILKRDDGVLGVAEVDLSIAGVRINTGYWRYSRPFQDVADPVERRGNQGFYALVEGQLFAEPEPDQGLNGFVRAGWADDRFNAIGTYVGAGLVYRGLLPGRAEDEFGVAVAIASVGDETRDAVRAGGGRIERREVALECTYRVQVTRWFAVQPDVQVILDPGFDPSLRNTVVVAIRFELIL